MHLWNDYENKTVAGAFVLGTLLRTEGRSASFATRDRAGRAAVIRLTEALNDQQQMRARYRAVQGIGHPNLVRIEDFGETELDGTPLIYLVLESTEESLAEIVRDRRLSVEETGEVAQSVVGALEALHAAGMVHGLVEPASVLAAGEVIKLRSDCVRPAAEGAEGDRARREDVLDMADVLHRSLTQGRLQDASDALALPEPYAAIVRNVVRGSWGIEQVASELRRGGRGAVAAAVSPRVPVVSPAPMPRAGGAETPSFAESLAAVQRVVDRASAEGEAGSVTDTVTIGAGGAAGESVVPFYAAPGVAAAAASRVASGAASGAEMRGRSLGRDREDGAERSKGPSRLMLVVGAVAVVLLAVLIWRWTEPSGAKTEGAGSPGRIAASGPSPAGRPGGGGAGSAADAQASVGAKPSAGREGAASVRGGSHDGAGGAADGAPAPVASAAAAPAGRAGQAGQTGQAGLVPPAGSGGKIWRVVAFTYNREEQAEAKVRAVAERHAELHPEVFSRSGGAPYLVTLGGPLSQEQAAAVREKARRVGLARDVYMQNYSH